MPTRQRRSRRDLSSNAVEAVELDAARRCKGKLCAASLLELASALAGLDRVIGLCLTTRILDLRVDACLLGASKLVGVCSAIERRSRGSGCKSKLHHQ
jgi:hypothetical protein